jgi:hypothetical protein
MRKRESEVLIMVYTIDNGIVYDNHVTANGATGLVAIGNAQQYSTTETGSQTIYQWQTFNLDTGVYINDTSNTTPIMGITPTNGQVVIDNLPAIKAAQKQLIMAAYQNALAAGFTSSANGTATQYPYNTLAEQSYDELYLELLTPNKITYPVNVFDINDNPVPYADATHLQALYADIITFKSTTNGKMHGYLTQIDEAPDAATALAVVWS